MVKIIKTQIELDNLKKIDIGERVIIESALRLNCILEVFGVLSIQAKLDCNRSEQRYIVAWENSSVVARENSSVVARGNSSVVAWENSSVEAWENSSVEAWGQTFVRAFSTSIKLALNGFSLLSIPFDLKLKYKKTKTAVVQKYKPLPYLEREGVPIDKGKVILFKRVSKDYKTQEGEPHETLWLPGTTLTHPAWDPTVFECGKGKFHAYSRPYFCDEFHNIKNDVYVAIEIAKKDLYEWPSPVYPHKIAFRRGRVLYRCDRFGKKLTN